MPELKRNFMQGRMNKDLDERLVSDGEYRDALNIQVSTAEGSDVGTARNIVSNKALNLVSYYKPYAKRIARRPLAPMLFEGDLNALGEPLSILEDGRKSDYITVTQNTFDGMSSTAQVVGAIADERENAIYSLVADAFDYESQPSKFHSVQGTVTAVATTSVSNDTLTLNSDIADDINVGDYVFSDVSDGILKDTKVLSKTDLGATTKIVMDKSYAGSNAVDDVISIHRAISVGRKADIITKLIPDAVVSGSSKMEPVFVDVYEVRANWPFWSGDAVSNTVSFQTNHTNFPTPYEDITHAHTAAVLNTDVINGLEIGMTVDAVDVDGNSLWDGTYNGVYVEDVQISWNPGGGIVAVNATPTNTVITLTLSKPVLLTEAQVRAGAVLKFNKERILNFKTGPTYSYTDKDFAETTVSSATPEGTKVTAIDVVDDMLFFTTDYDEPKKINITKGVEGSKLNIDGSLGDTPNLYATTRYYFEADDTTTEGNVVLWETMKKSDVTVARIGPISPPKLWMRDTKRLGPGGRDAMCNEVGLGGPLQVAMVGNAPSDEVPMPYGQKEASDFSFFNQVGENYELDLGNETIEYELHVDPSLGYEAGKTNYFDKIIQRYPYQGGWKSGDILALYNGKHGYRVKVQIVEDPTVETIEHHFGYDEKKITKIKVILVDANAGYQNAATDTLDVNSTTTPLACKWVAYLDSEEAGSMYEEKFVRFAYRWRYKDGEVSPISPFTEPAFMPKCPYLYNSDNGQNEAIKNNLKWLAVTNFLGGGKLTESYGYPTFGRRRNSLRPIDIDSVDILYKEDGNTNVYLLKNIKRSTVQSAPTPIGEFSVVEPSSSWNHSGYQGGDKHIPLSTVNPLIGVGNFWGSAPSAGPILGPYTLDETTFAGLTHQYSHNHLSDFRFYNASHNRGFYIVPPGTVGSVIPEMQVFRPFDNVPITAKAQCISSSRLIYANYQEGYDLVDSNRKKINFNFSSKKSLEHNYSLDFKQGIGIISTDGRNGRGRVAPGLKRNRTYTVGVVFKDRYGRESSVIVGKDAAFSLGQAEHRSGVSDLRLSVCPKGTIPYWAEYYKYFVKETSNEYYNLAMHAAYPALLSDGAPSLALEYWVSFNSTERNKIKEDDTLILTKPLDHWVGINPNQYKVLAISNEAPNPTTIPGIGGAEDTAHPNPELPEGISVSDEDKKGKFFVKIKADAALRKNFRNATNGMVRTRANTAIFQTLPDQGPDLDIYYEVGGANPVYLWNENIENFIEPGDRVTGIAVKPDGTTQAINFGNPEAQSIDTGTVFYHKIHNSIQSVYGSPIKGLDKNIVKLRVPMLMNFHSGSDGSMIYEKAYLRVCKHDRTVVTLEINLDESDNSASVHAINQNFKGFLDGDKKVKYQSGNCVFYIKSYNWGKPQTLPFYNCFTFENGVETDRILDKFNSTKLDNGVKVSTVSSNYKRKHLKHGLIFSGIYNSKNGVNSLNQFIAAEGITKDLNPEYGSIQKLFSRNTDIVTFCEDKVLKVLSSKDALFNADGNTNLTASNRVLGTAIPFSGDFGISRNPESFAENEFRCYFTDRARGAVLRLSKDGLTKISDIGMKNYFADNLKSAAAAVGSFNSRKDEYDLTIHSAINATASTKEVNTLSFNESTNGWVSFRGYALEHGLSLNNTYYTFNSGKIWEHGVNPGSAARNNFYGTQYYSSVTPVFNDMPSSVKSFNLLNYEGSQARVVLVNDDDAYATRTPDQNYQEYYNNVAREGWYVESISTDQQEGNVLEFKEKEGKWFNSIQGLRTTWANTLGGGDGSGSGNLDSQEISFQGIGSASGVLGSTTAGTLRTITATMNQTGGSNAPTIVGDSDSLLTGASASSVESTVTLTAASGYVLGNINLDSDAFNAVGGVTVGKVVYNGISYDVDTDIPTAGQVTVTLTIIYDDINVSADLAFNLGFTMTSVALVDHTLKLCFEFFSDIEDDTTGVTISNNSQPYSIVSPLAVSTDYTVGSYGEEFNVFNKVLGNIFDATYEISAENINPYNNSTQIAYFKLIADEGFYFNATDIAKITNTLSTVDNDGLATTPANDSGGATVTARKTFNQFNDASDSASITLSSADGNYNFQYTYDYDISGNVNSITVGIFYNPDTSGTGSQSNVDFLRIPALLIENAIEIPIFDDPSDFIASDLRVRIGVEDVDVAADNPYFIDHEASTPPFSFTFGSLKTNAVPSPDTNYVDVVAKSTVFHDEATVATSTTVVSQEDLDDIFEDFLIVLAPNVGQVINVSSITSFLGVAVASGDLSASTGVLTFRNQEYYVSGDPGVVSFEGQTIDYYPNSGGNSTYGANNLIPVKDAIKSVEFSNLGNYIDGVFAGADEADNKVLMTIKLAPNVSLYPDILLAANWEAGAFLRIPAPAMSTTSAAPTLNHKYSLFIDEIDYILAAGGASHVDFVTTHKYGYSPTGLTLTQTEQTNYDAYNHDGLGTSSVNATLTSITFEQLLAGTGGANPSGTSNWTGLRFDSDNHGKYYEVDIHGAYSSGAVATHKFKYTATQVESTDTEFVMYNLVDTTAIRINDQDKLDEFMDIASENDLTKGSIATQLGNYKLHAAGTFSSGKCTAIEFTISYETSVVGSEVQTDTDYYFDPLIISPSFVNAGRFVLARKKII